MNDEKMHWDENEVWDDHNKMFCDWINIQLSTYFVWWAENGIFCAYSENFEFVMYSMSECLWTNKM